MKQVSCETSTREKYKLLGCRRYKVCPKCKQKQKSRGGAKAYLHHSDAGRSYIPSFPIFLIFCIYISL